MPKIRTNRTAAKRFKVTGTGKITRLATHNGHMFFHKSGARKRRLEQEPEVFKGEQHHVRKLLQMKNPNVKKSASKKTVDRAAEAAKIQSLVG